MGGHHRRGAQHRKRSKATPVTAHPTCSSSLRPSTTGSAVSQTTGAASRRPRPAESPPPHQRRRQAEGDDHRGRLPQPTARPSPLPRDAHRRAFHPEGHTTRRTTPPQNIRTAPRPRLSPPRTPTMCPAISASEEEGEGFEPSVDREAHNGFEPLSFGPSSQTQASTGAVWFARRGCRSPALPLLLRDAA
jgi:hypothetical protein